MTGLGNILRARPFGAMTFSGYCPRNSKVGEKLKELLLWAFAKNDGASCVMSVAVMRDLLEKRWGVRACKRTVEYALKRLQLEGFISRQSRWLKLADGTVKRCRSVTRGKGRFVMEQLKRGWRGLKLAAMTWWPNGDKELQKIADGYYIFLKDVSPPPLK